MEAIILRLGLLCTEHTTSVFKGEFLTEYLVLQGMTNINGINRGGTRARKESQLHDDITGGM